MKSLRKILLAGIVLGLIGALILSAQDYSEQANYNTLLPVLDYDSLVEWSETTGNKVTDILNTAYTNNIKTAAITELQLSYGHDESLQGFFKQDEFVSAYKGTDLIKEIRTGIKSSEFTSYLNSYNLLSENIYLLVTSDKRANELYSAAVKKYGDSRIKKMSVTTDKAIIEITSSKNLPINGLGFDPQVITLLQDNNFNIIPRPFNAAYSAEDKQVLENYFEYMRNEFNPPTIIFAGEEGVLGMPVNNSAGLLNITASNLQTKKNADSQNLPLYGHVEMATIDGDKKLAANLDYNLARVHSISSNEWKERYNAGATEATISSVVERYNLAFNDRGVHIFYIRPFMKSVEFNENYFKGLTANSKRVLGTITPVPGRLTLPSWALILITIGVGCALLLLFVQVFKKAIKLTYIFLGLGVVGSIGAIIVAPSYHILIQKLIALASSIAFPTLAIIIGFLWMNESKTKTDLAKKLLVVIGVTLIGGIYVHGSLAIIRFMTSIDVFPMVKIALLMPVPLAFLILLLDDNGKNNISNLLNMNVKMYHAIIAGIAVVALGLLVIRSGNNPSIGVTGIELRVRAILQKVLIARPRFKEFAIGVPMLVLAAWLQLKNRSTLIPLTIGAIGLASMVNTFAHLHKPLWMAFLTTFNGVWVGILVGILFVVVYEILDHFKLFEIIE